MIFGRLTYFYDRLNKSMYSFSKQLSLNVSLSLTTNALHMNLHKLMKLHYIRIIVGYVEKRQNNSHF